MNYLSRNNDVESLRLLRFILQDASCNN